MRSQSRRDRKPAKRRRSASVSDSSRKRRRACLWPSAATRNAVAGISITMTVAAPHDAYRTRAMRCRGHPTRDQKDGRGQARDAGFGTEVASGAFVIWRTDPPARIVYLVSHGGRSETREGSARHHGRAQAAGSEAAATAVARGEHRPGFAVLRGSRGPGPQAVPVARGAARCRSRAATRQQCTCHYEHHDDRRKGPRRASELGVSVDSYYGLEKVDKRGGPKRGRRKTDR